MISFQSKIKSSQSKYNHEIFQEILNTNTMTSSLDLMDATQLVEKEDQWLQKAAIAARPKLRKLKTRSFANFAQMPFAANVSRKLEFFQKVKQMKEVTSA